MKKYSDYLRELIKKYKRGNDEKPIEESESVIDGLDELHDSEVAEDRVKALKAKQKRLRGYNNKPRNRNR